MPSSSEGIVALAVAIGLLSLSAVLLAIEVIASGVAVWLGGFG